MKFEELESLVIQWAEEKGILAKATSLTQLGKTKEELDETIKALVEENHDEVIDGFGDIVVTLIISAHIYGTTLCYCLEMAYNVIKSRTGNMVDGVFVKDK